MTVACPCCGKEQKVETNAKVKCSACNTSYNVVNKGSSGMDDHSDLGNTTRSYVIPRESQRDMERRRMALMKGQR